MKAIGNRIIIKKDKPNEMEGSIWVPKKDGKYAPPYIGTVICVGPLVKDSEYKEGIRVLFHDLAGTEFMYEGDKYLSVKEKEITSIIYEKNLNIV